ncbi:MAG: NUDIX domain-containing protein [bacterium]|nr:NUDIX domain-containing protein [bacterium]
MKPESDQHIKEFSAGGIVFCGEKVLILVNFRNDYVFPKGHIEEGETVEQAAIREVQEEAGVSGRILCSLGTTQYKFIDFIDRRSWRHKTVNWVLMEVDSEAVCCDGKEIKSGRFTTVAEASRLLTHAQDKKILKKACEEMAKC